MNLNAHEKKRLVYSMNSCNIGKVLQLCNKRAFKKRMTMKVLCIVLLVSSVVLGGPNDNINYVRDCKGMETCLRLFLNCNERLQRP